jgi:hypothetical protein
MKSRIVALSLMLAAAPAFAQTPAVSKIEGAFGKKLGDAVDVGAERLVRGVEGLQYIVTFTPAEGYPGLNRFAICVTPYSHVTFKVDVSGTLPTPAAVENLRRTLELKYGPFVRLSDNGDTVRWKFTDGERSIVLLVTDHAVTVYYIDDGLAATARIESTTGAAAIDGKGL